MLIKEITLFCKSIILVLGGGINVRQLTFPRFFIPFLLIVVYPTFLLSQSNYLQEDKRYIVRAVKFDGNKSFADSRLRDLIVTQESPPRFSVWMNTKVSSRFGSPPSFFSEFDLIEDVDRIIRYYIDNGFFEIDINTNVAIDDKDTNVQVTFHIDEGERYLVNKIRYHGLENIDADVLDEITQKPLVTEGKPYRRTDVEQEYQRILDILYNKGYAKAAVEDIQVHYSEVTQKVEEIDFIFVPDRQYTFGEIQIQIEHDKGYGIHPSIIYRQLEYEMGEIYSLRKRTESERNLNRLGIFESAKIDIRIPPSDDPINKIPSTVVVRPRSKHEITPEVLVNDENNAFNVGLGIGYANRNFLGDARILNLRTRFRVQSIQELQLVRVINEHGLRDSSVIGGIEIAIELTQPYIITRKTSGRWGASFQVEKQPQFRLNLLRNRISINHQFSTTTYGFFDWTLERASLRALWGTDVEIGDRPVGLLRQFEGPQFNSIFSFTLQRDRTDDVFSPKQGYFHSITFEEGGILPKLMSYLGEQLPFAQYIKTTFTGRWYFPLEPRQNNIMAFKVKTGYGTLYGKENRTPIPLHRRYFAGGSGSIRGWKTRELGMVPDPSIGGNVLLEGNAELRINILRSLGEFPIDFRKLWGVLFLDAGNIWDSSTDVRFSEIALATGFGLRYDTFVGPLRVDFGFKLFDPREKPNRQWLFNRPFFRDIAFHFGIGHAF